MRVFLTGGTGLIGRRLVRRLIERGDRPVVVSRRAEALRGERGWSGVDLVAGDPGGPGDWQRAVGGCDAAVNLVGHNIFGGRWNDQTKHLMRDSRVYGTGNLVAAIARAEPKPATLVQASAIGYYGPRGDEELTEDAPAGDDFLARVCREWEAAAQPAADLGLRLATVRIGVVLAKGEGALKVMTPVFKMGAGSPVGSGGRLGPARGQQWLSWIHLDDIVGILLLALDNPSARGPINGTAPNPVRNVDFGRTLARVLGRWFVPIGPPDFLLRAGLGGVADVVVTGQRVVPARALALGYRFAYPELEPALRQLFDRPAPRGTDAAGTVTAG
jgi:uncharacterized protein (TIGR01777 family)